MQALNLTPLGDSYTSNQEKEFDRGALVGLLAGLVLGIIIGVIVAAFIFFSIVHHHNHYYNNYTPTNNTTFPTNNTTFITFFGNIIGNNTICVSRNTEVPCSAFIPNTSSSTTIIPKNIEDICINNINGNEIPCNLNSTNNISVTTCYNAICDKWLIGNNSLLPTTTIFPCGCAWINTTGRAHPTPCGCSSTTATTNNCTFEPDTNLIPSQIAYEDKWLISYVIIKCK